MRVLRALAATAATLLANAAYADELPVTIQVQLLSKMATYVADCTPGDSGALKVLVVHPGAQPSRSAQAIAGAIAQAGQFGSYKVSSGFVPLADAPKLKAVFAKEKPQFIFVAPEFDERSIAAIVDAAGASTAVTVTGAPDHVKQGVVLGFSMVEARPRVLVNLKQANKQGISFHNGLLRYAVIVDK